MKRAGAFGPGHLAGDGDRIRQGDDERVALGKAEAGDKHHAGIGDVLNSAKSRIRVHVEASDPIDCDETLIPAPISVIAHVDRARHARMQFLFLPGCTHHRVPPRALLRKFQ
jgi:hypothetical protein